MKKILFLMSVFLLAELIFATTGETVTQNLAYHIGETKTDDSERYNNQYVSTYDQNVSIALISGNKYLSTNKESYSETDYIISSNQRFKDNRFFLVFTKGNYQDIEDDLDAIENGNLFMNTFYDFASSVTSLKVYLLLNYLDVDLTSNLELRGSADLFMKNNGKTDGKYNISMSMVE